MTAPAGPAAPAAPARRRPSPLWYSLLAPPFVGLLWVPFYNSVEPTLGGIPFFYLYQSAWILVSTALTTAVYFATRDDS